MTKPPRARVLFVCLGNICRSPSAEAVLRKLACEQGFELTVDSAGTSGYHITQAPDARAISVGEGLGYELSDLRARQVSVQDLHRFDLIFAMDTQNLADLWALQAQHSQQINPDQAQRARILLFDDVSVANPYHGTKTDFVEMFAHLERRMMALLAGERFEETALAGLMTAEIGER